MRTTVAAWIAALLFALALALMALRLHAGVSIATLAPKIEWLLDLQIGMDLHGEDAVARVVLPQDGPGQSVRDERIESSNLAFAIESVQGRRVAAWQARAASGHRSASYHAIVDVQRREFVLPEAVPMPDTYPEELAAHLQSTESIQVDAPEIMAAASEIAGADGERDVAALMRRTWSFVSEHIRNSEYENTLDALTTLRWKEAFCGGKSRLLVALLRANRVPARMVGGLILESGSKRTTHAWVEAWFNGQWVPLDALNGHFAVQPANYLVLYRGDHALISRTANINFQYTFKIKRWRTPPDEQLRADDGSPIPTTYGLWRNFRKAEISLNLLRILLMLPIGVLVLLALRNLIGMRLVGTFMPALMAVALRDTGLVWGVVVFIVVVICGLLVRAVVDRLQLLHLSRLAVLLIAVVATMLAISWWSVRHGLLEPAHVTMFPIAILTLTTEGLFLKAQERGPLYALAGVANTLIAVAAVYLVVENHFLQALVFLFPEILLAVLATYLVIGRYAGLRLLELRRFRLLASEGTT